MPHGGRKSSYCAMRAHPRTSYIAKFTILITTLARACAATVPAPPSTDDKWIYPDVNTLPTYNYLDTVNASWTSNFFAPYLLLRCQHPNDALHYAYPYNQSVSATGLTFVPLDDGNAWVCHFEVSDLGTPSATPPMFISNDFNIVLHAGQKPVLWTDSQDGGGTAASSAASVPTSSPTASAISTSTTTTSSVTTTDTPLTSASSTPTTTPASSSTPTSSSAMTPTPTQPPASPTPSNTPSGLSKSKKVAIIVGSTMGALLLLIIAIAVLFILRTRRSEQNAVVYRSRLGNGYGSKEVPGLEAPRERWKGVEVPHGQMQGYF